MHTSVSELPKSYSVIGSAWWGWSKGYLARRDDMLVFLKAKQTLLPGKVIFTDRLSLPKEIAIIKLTEIRSFSQHSCLFGGEVLTIPNTTHGDLRFKLSHSDTMLRFHGALDSVEGGSEG